MAQDKQPIYYIDPEPRTIPEARARLVAYMREMGEESIREMGVDGDVEAGVDRDLAGIDPALHLQYLIDAGDCVDATLQAGQDDATQAEIERAGVLIRMIHMTYFEK